VYHKWAFKAKLGHNDEMKDEDTGGREVRTSLESNLVTDKRTDHTRDVKLAISGFRRLWKLQLLLPCTGIN
jgi:hypothetical protein